MDELLNEQIEIIRRRYEEAFLYVSGDVLLSNPQKAFSIFEKLADEGFVSASFYCGLMLCMGLGTEKDISKGKEILKTQEKYFGYVTEVVMEQNGLFEDLTKEEQFKCIDYWKNNHQMSYALHLQCKYDINKEL